ncbi:MAG: hypothetical protein K2O22_03980, partial [Anaeroplasmataceae bacterium]|nr:hypothetical protein [Anaeroplasmataceae bacterium]
FNYLDLFYLIDSKSKGIAIFQDRLMGNSYGLQLHFGDAGINYLYDSYMTNTGLMLNSVFANMMTISMVAKEDLIPDDIAFLKKHKIRIQAKNNLIPCLFQEGHDYSYLSIKNMQDAIRYIYYLLSLIRNEREDILKAFSEEQLVLAAFDSVHGYYEVRYTADITLGTMPRFKKSNSEFVLEYQGKTYVDETLYISRYYSPVKVEKTAYYESVLFAYLEPKGSYNLYRICC